MLLSANRLNILFEEKIFWLIKLFNSVEDDSAIKLKRLGYTCDGIDELNNIRVYRGAYILYFRKNSKILEFHYIFDKKIAHYYINEDNKLVSFVFHNNYQKIIENFVNGLYEILIG